MPEDNKPGKMAAFLRLRHTGKLVALVNAGIYGLVSYYAITWLKAMIRSDDGALQSIGIVLLLLIVGILGWFRDFITDVADMQSYANKERDAHENTKNSLASTNEELLRCRKIIHAIRSGFSNTMMQRIDDQEKMDKIIIIIEKINQDYSVNNITEEDSTDANKDYRSIFC